MQETLDHLAGDWRIYQLKGGHRFSADDLLTAWTAARVCPQADEILDLGSGLGSVGLLTLWKLPKARLTGVEVQQLSYDLALKTRAHNRLGDRVQFLHQDMRAPLTLGRFPLVTGSPPYFPLGKATVSPHPQRTARRRLRLLPGSSAASVTRWSVCLCPRGRRPASRAGGSASRADLALPPGRALSSPSGADRSSLCERFPGRVVRSTRLCHPRQTGRLDRRIPGNARRDGNHRSA